MPGRPHNVHDRLTGFGLDAIRPCAPREALGEFKAERLYPKLMGRSVIRAVQGATRRLGQKKDAGADDRDGDKYEYGDKEEEEEEKTPGESGSVVVYQN